jgi:hypothetical protein
LPERFTYAGRRVLTTDKQNRPVKACAVQYMPRQLGGENMPPLLTCVDMPQMFTYAYADDTDKVGKETAAK